MILLYYFVLAFGVLLLLFTASAWFKTTKKVNARETNFSEKLDKTVKKLQKTGNLWFYYFTAGDKNNLVRNIIIHFLIFIGLYYLNSQFIRFNNQIFMVAELIGFIVAVWKLGQRRNRKLFNEKFPEVIQVLNSATSSGISLLQALERCGKDITGPIGEEFTMIYKRLARGEDAMAVFHDSYSRYPYKEFYFFISIIRTNLSRGGQMREVISRLGRAIADSNKMEQKKKAMTSEARMSAAIVACFPVAFFLFMKVTTPENFDFVVNDPGGRIILYYVVGSELLGMFIIWWLMRKST
ncbi:type II secretion system F family protein [Actinobacillus equuli]|uniref:type II secretion system F family protein n=1 Tax=Actinobacillus equuli TaxID=718 RepID=UPI0024413FB3|nr:type II secretion system F family protein [Actinobacillus equuli]WGE57931.1 type II secretion system F family protein [Actinobacillus equuli subsp. equuli]